MEYKLVIVSKKIDHPVNGRAWMEANCTFLGDGQPLLENIVIKSPVDSFQETANEKCEELENIFDQYNSFPEGKEIEIDRAERERAREELREQERIAAEKAEAERIEQEKLAAEQAEAERLDAESLATEATNTIIPSEDTVNV